MAASCLLIGDIGGTNARFALADPDAPGFSKEQTLACADFRTAGDAVNAYLAGASAGEPDAICIAAAGPVVDGRVRFTNNHWTLDAADLTDRFDTDKVLLLNDFEAIAYSVPFLQPSECAQCGLLPPKELGTDDFTVGIVGPGTGLGGAGLLQRAGRLTPIVGEAGHVGFAPESQLQMKLLNALREEFDRVSDERVVSGPGLENIYSALCRIHNEPVVNITAKAVVQRAANNGDPRASEALQLFYEVLGQVAGNLALVLGASDGIYIAGGIVKRDPGLFANSRFRSGFERKGRHRSLMERIPTQVIMHPEPGLLGAAYRCLSLVQSA